MHQTIHDSLSALKSGPTATFRNFAVTALLRGDVGTPDYLTLDEALKAGTARVTEVSQAGSVPELRFENTGELPVLLLDGEELVGAKQNRILNVSIFAPPKQAIIVPVSCVEAGRWNYRSSEFSSEGRAFFAEGRMQKIMQVTESLRQGGSRRADQSAVWDAIALKSARMGVRSETGAMADMYSGHAANIEDYVQAVPLVAGQVGAAFLINGQVRGVEFFDFPQTLGKLLPKLVRSYALDAIDEEKRTEQAPANDEGFERFLADLRSAKVERFPSVGEGEDLRLSGERVAGGALTARDRIVHLCAFRVRGPHTVYDRESPLARPSTRSRRYRLH